MWLDGLSTTPALTPAGSRTHTAVWKRQTGGMNQYALVTLHVAPVPGHAGVLVDNAVQAGSLPPEYFPGIVDGVRDHVEGGDARPTLGGFRVLVMDARHHLVDSSRMAFRLATRTCLTEILEHVGTRPWVEAPAQTIKQLATAVADRLVGAQASIRQAIEPLFEQAGFERHDEHLFVKPVGDVIQTVEWQGSAPSHWSGLGLRLGIVVPSASEFFLLGDPLEDTSRFPNNHLGHTLTGLVPDAPRWWPVEDNDDTIDAITTAWNEFALPHFEQPFMRSQRGVLAQADHRETPRFYVSAPLRVALLHTTEGVEASRRYLDDVMVPKEADMPWTLKENITLRRRLDELASNDG